MPDFLFEWSIWWINFLHTHPFVWWPMIIMGAAPTLLKIVRGR